MGLMLSILDARGEVAVVGRHGKQRRLGSRRALVPARRSPSRSPRRSGIARAEQRFRALGVWLEKGGWLAHPEATDGPVPDRATLLSPFDRLDPRPRPRRGAVGFRYRLEMYVPKAKREYGYYVLPILAATGSSGAPSRSSTARRKTLALLGAWWRARRGWTEAARRPRVWPARRGSAASIAADGLRDARDPRGPGARPGDRRGHDADLPDLHVRAGGGRRPQGLRLLARREPDAHARSRPASRRSRAPSTASRSRPGSARRRRSCTWSTRASASSPSPTSTAASTG